MKAKHVVTALLLVFVAASFIAVVVSEAGRSHTPVTTSVAGPLMSGTDSAVASSETTVAAAAPPVAPAARAIPRQAARRDSPLSAPAASQLIIYYFHGEFRCVTCKRIEAMTREAVLGGFSKELDAGRVVWRVVNVEEPGHEHFVRDFQLFTKAVVIVTMKEGKTVAWKNLDRIWKLVNDEAAFKAYIITSVKDAFGATG